MLFLVFSVILVMWFIIIKIRGKLSWHSVFGIVVITLVITDIADIVLCNMLLLYSLHLNLFKNTEIDMKNAILISDLIIFPVAFVIYCYYYARYRKWWIPLLFPIAFSFIESLFVHYKYMQYHRFHLLYTFIMYVAITVIMTCLCDRLINYTPPIPYTVMIIPSTYVIIAFPGTILGTIMQLFLWRPSIFENYISDNWVAAISQGLFSGILAGVGFLIFKSKRSRNWVILFIGLINIIVSFVLHSKGILVYYKWNSIVHALTISGSTILLLSFNEWEVKYRERKPRTETKRRLLC